MYYVGGNKNPPRYNEIILVAARFAFFAMSSTGDLVIWPHDDSLRDFLVLYSHPLKGNANISGAISQFLVCVRAVCPKHIYSTPLVTSFKCFEGSIRKITISARAGFLASVLLIKINCISITPFSLIAVFVYAISMYI